MALHWLVAALIVVNIAAGLAGADAGQTPDARRIVDLHKSVGLTILGLVILRLLWRLAKTPPPLPPAYPKAERVLAHAAHAALYAVMLALPLTGYIHDSAWKEASTHPIVLYGLLPFPRIGPIQALDPSTREHVHDLFGASHVWLGYVLYGLLGLHLAGVAKHHAIGHEAELARMLPEGYRRPPA